VRASTSRPCSCSGARLHGPEHFAGAGELGLVWSTFIWNDVLGEAEVEELARSPSSTITFSGDVAMEHLGRVAGERLEAARDRERAIHRQPLSEEAAERAPGHVLRGEGKGAELLLAS
jgi:hypothetical protein